MFFHNLTNECVTKRVINATVAGQTDITSAAIDTLGYAGFRVVALAGTITDTSVSYVKVQDCDTSGGSYNDVAGSKQSFQTTGDSNNMIILDILKPTKRFIKVIFSRATANCVIDGVLVELYHADYGAPSKDTTVSAQKILVAPIDGTA